MTGPRLGDVDRFDVPAAVTDATDRALRDAGRLGQEAFVLWTGLVDGPTFTAAAAYVPEQTAHRLPDGVCVTVGGDALHQLNRWLYDNEQSLAVQVHTHPGRAYHSTTDSAYPIVTQTGGLSLVVPDFAFGGVRGPGTALYRLGTRGWRRMRGRAARRLLLLGADERVEGGR
jgi:hypothetical protein